MSYNPQYLKAKVATAVAESVSVAVKVATIGLVTELGRFVEVLFKQDDVGLTDTEKRAVYKVSADAYVALDKYISALSKAKTDASAVADKEYAAVAKVLKDLTGLLDHYKATIHKPFYDQVVGLEEHVYVFAKKAPENFVHPSDRIDTKAVAKLRQDAWAVSDDDVVEFYKNRTDAAGFSDERYRFIEKVLTDSVNTTDDIDGAASIDDDQEVQFFKVISELTATQDEFYRFMAFVRNFSDAAAVSDNTFNVYSKPFGELVTGVEDHAYVLSRKTPDSPTEFVDAAAYSASKPISDASIVSDDDTVQFTKDRQEAAWFSDNNVKDSVKAVADQSGANDSAALAVQKALSDTFNAADFLDYITIVVKRDFSEYTPFSDAVYNNTIKPLASSDYSVSDKATVTPTKALAELAFWSEILYRTTNKSLVDTYGVSESKAISAVKPTNDGFSLTDSGSLRSQSYCDFTYIAENYVGESRTF